MITITPDEIKEQYPQFNDVPDQLINAMIMVAGQFFECLENSYGEEVGKQLAIMYVAYLLDNSSSTGGGNVKSVKSIETTTTFTDGSSIDYLGPLQQLDSKQCLPIHTNPDEQTGGFAVYASGGCK